VNDSVRAARRALVGVTGALVLLAAPRLARAQQADVARAPAVPASPPQNAAQGGNFLPLTLPADVGRARVFAFAFGGYDTAAQNARFVSFAEAHVYGPLALRFSAQSTGASERIAPSLAGRVQFLSELEHGVDAAFSVAYNAEGFTEFEGEIELVLAFGKTLGNWRLLGNLAYGQDPEGHERDAELRAAALYRFGKRYYFGFDARGRVGLSPEADTEAGRAEPLFDVDAGPVLNVALGPLVLGAHAGLSALEFAGSHARFGAVALAGLGTAL
jgi:hypothetical protein